jgi:phosphonate degradation associated HDIG domain protein
MRRLSNLREIARLYATRGGLSYGEGVSQLEHALQSAALAEAAGARSAAVAGALLHDVGHLLSGEAESAAVDLRHEAKGAQMLAGLFGPDVRGPIALHVAAKRYLCAREPGYHEALSTASQASLALQGGAFDEAGADAFERRPFWREAVALRRWDDLAKRAEPCGRRFEDFLPALRAALADPARG